MEVRIIEVPLYTDSLLCFHDKEPRNIIRSCLHKIRKIAITKYDGHIMQSSTIYLLSSLIFDFSNILTNEH